MSDIRAEVEAIIIDHFDPSVMARALVVDEILALIEEHNEALTNPMARGANNLLAEPPIFLRSEGSW